MQFAGKSTGRGYRYSRFDFSLIIWVLAYFTAENSILEINYFCKPIMTAQTTLRAGTIKNSPIHSGTLGLGTHPSTILISIWSSTKVPYDLKIIFLSFFPLCSSSSSSSVSESKNNLVLGHKFWMLFDRKSILQYDIEYCRMQKSLKLISHLNSNRTPEP